MKCKIEKIEGKNVIILSNDFMKFHNLKTGNVVDMSDIYKTKQKKKCKSITSIGLPCTHVATLGAYCTIHYRALRNKAERMK